jgi:hypothetical protein
MTPIKNETECGSAAIAKRVGMWINNDKPKTEPLTMTAGSWADKPPGCFAFRPNGTRPKDPASPAWIPDVFFNTATNSTTACSSPYRCLCATPPLTKWFVNETCPDTATVNFLAKGLKMFRLQNAAVGAWFNVLVYFMLAHAASIPSPTSTAGTFGFFMWTSLVLLQAAFMVIAIAFMGAACYKFTQANIPCLVPWDNGRTFFGIVGMFSVGFHPTFIA